MKVKEILEMSDAVDSVEIHTAEFNALVFRGSSNIIEHSVSRETLAPYLDRNVRKFVVAKSTIFIYCD